MKKNKVLKIINPILAILVLYQVITGSMHEVIPKESFEAVHVSGGVALVVFVIIHLLLNWNWVRASFFGSRNKKEKKGSP